MKILKTIFALLFIIFAALQINDPDSWLWIIIYAGAAVLIILDISGVRMKNIYGLAIIIFLLFSFLYFPGVITYFKEGEPGELVDTMKAEKPYIEETREFFGLIIIVILFTFLYIKSSASLRSK